MIALQEKRRGNMQDIEGSEPEACGVSKRKLNCCATEVFWIQICQKKALVSSYILLESMKTYARHLPGDSLVAHHAETQTPEVEERWSPQLATSQSLVRQMCISTWHW
jgi:hypothetical protein